MNLLLLIYCNYKNVDKMCECHTAIRRLEMIFKTAVSSQQIFLNFTLNFLYERCVQWRARGGVKVCVSACKKIYFKKKRRTLDRENSVTNPLHIMAPLMATRCGGVTL